MPYTVDLLTPIHGIAGNTAEEDENVNVLTYGFNTDNEGEVFYKTLEGITELFLRPEIPSEPTLSRIDHFLVLINDKEKKATVYVNELQILIHSIARRDLQEGESVTEADMIGVSKLSFINISIPEDHGIAFFFSNDWRRGFFFDFRPNIGSKLENIETTLGKCFEMVLYNKWYRLDDNLKNALSNLGWFPFLGIIGNPHFDFLVSRLRDGNSTKKAESRLVESFNEAELKAIENRLKANAFLSPHIQFFEVSIERYLSGDYISAISVINAKVEGIIRHVYNDSRSATIKGRLDSLESSFDGTVPYPGIFFPKYFREYLQAYHFQNFDPSTNHIEFSRNSHSHGVSNVNDYDRKRALLGILMIEQLSYYVSTGRKPTV